MPAYSRRSSHHFHRFRYVIQGFYCFFKCCSVLYFREKEIWGGRGSFEFVPLNDSHSANLTSLSVSFLFSSVCLDLLFFIFLLGNVSFSSELRPVAAGAFCFSQKCSLAWNGEVKVEGRGRLFAPIWRGWMSGTSVFFLFFFYCMCVCLWRKKKVQKKRCHTVRHASIFKHSRRDSLFLGRNTTALNHC